MAVTPKIRRTYKGAAPQATLGVSGVTSSSQTSIGLSASPTGWPTGKFFVVVAPGTAYEEKMCVTISGSTLTVVDPNNTSTAADSDGRGVDDTTARSTIPGGSVVYPVFTARDADEANQLTSTYVNQGGMVYMGDPSFTQLAIGTAGQVLKVNSGATAPEWGQVGTAGIADGAITTDKIASGAVTLSDLATAVQNFLVPVGTISAYGGASAPTGWLLCDGSAINGAYTALIALVGANTPDLRGRFPMGKTAAGTGSTLLGTGGSTTIAEANLPSHSHSFSATTGGMSANATLSHSITDPGHTHVINQTQSINGGGFNQGLGAEYSAGGTTDSSTTGISIASHSVAHTHTVSGTTGTTGSGTAYFQPFVSVNFIIKHD